MPEEVNRVLTDHLSALLFVPSAGAEQQLRAEGITAGVHITGDVMFDSVLHYGPLAGRSPYPKRLGLEPRAYYLCTIHRAENTDDAGKLRRILCALNALPLPVVLPLHPRTRKQLAAFGIAAGDNVRLIDPVGYLDMLQLLQSSVAVLTDSGGVQKEAYYVAVPCVTLRSETEWTETVEAGWNRLVRDDEAAILDAAQSAMTPPSSRPNLYGDGRAATRIATILASILDA
jgi:UDP-GlcNAc3NAcA epimerase